MSEAIVKCYCLYCFLFCISDGEVVFFSFPLNLDR